ncbi:exosortase A [Halorhodospira halophila]|uniref:exosortase A n=1 Tax=Halorhodospira halophila TaxID=1053 RepID=UPI001912641C|nr:exosortase A [Halorhodospira halophila]MBK5936607.1 exosortase A [Halorhodospira halophila]
MSVEPRWAAWGPALLALGAGLIVLAGVFYPTFREMVAIWARSETFAHGFLIGPIVLLLTYRLRDRLARLTPQLAPGALVALAGLVLVWVLGALVDVASVRQFSAVLMIPALVWLLLGSEVARVLRFPLAYLLFAVPFGEFLVSPLMSLTADFTVAAVRLSGVPVHRAGLDFELPTGSWSVVEACSGVRYLIASLALGALYAYLVYRNPWRRALFMVAAALVPIVANGLRAYGIVMLGHASDMELAAGVDHLIYGWAFFALVTGLLFWVGTRWREQGAVVALSGPSPRGRVAPRRRFAALAVAAILLAGGPWYADRLNQRDLGPVAGLGDGPVAPSGWAPGEGELVLWQPGYHHARAERRGVVVAGGAPAVGLHIGYYRAQHRYGKMVGWENTLAGRERPEWRQQGSGRADVAGWPAATRMQLMGPDRELEVWRWYWVGGRLTTVPHEVKAREALLRLVGRRDDAALIVLYADPGDDPKAAREALHAYAVAALPEILDQLDAARRQ